MDTLHPNPHERDDMAIYNHLFDVAFSIEIDKEDWMDVTNDELLTALSTRIRSLRAEFIDSDTLDSPNDDCFGFHDTFEV
jgi:hypothetical protein